MPEPTAAEVIPKAIVRESIPATPAAGSAEAVARSISKKVDEGAWKAGLEELKKERIKPSAIGEKAEQIGINRDPATGKKDRTPEEEDRFTKFQQNAELAKKFLDQGFDKLTPVEKTTLLGGVLTEARAQGALAAELNKMSPAQQRAFAERILRDPQYAAKVQESLTGLLDPDQKLSNDIVGAQDKFDEKELEKQEKQEEIDDVDRRLTPINERIKAFERPAGGVPPGAKAKEMDDLRAEIPRLRAALPTLQRNEKVAQSKVDDLTEEFRASQMRGWTGRPTSDIFTELGGAKTELRTAQEDHAKTAGEIQKLKDLEIEEQTLEEQKQSLDREKRERRVEFDKIDLEFKKRQRILEDAKSVRTSQEEDLVDGVANIYSEAARNLFDEQMRAADTALQEELVALKAKTQDQNEQAMLNELQERWLGPEKTRRVGIIGARKEVKYRPIDKTQVEADFSVLMGGGPKEVMKNMLRTQINPATGANYTPAEADALVSNKEYTDKMQPDVVKQLLARKLMTGPLQPEDVHGIVNADWGQGMITAAVEKNNEFKKAVEEALGTGALNSPNFFERFGNEVQKTPILLWLLALVGGVAWAGVAAARKVDKLSIAE